MDSWFYPALVVVAILTAFAMGWGFERHVAIKLKRKEYDLIRLGRKQVYNWAEKAKDDPALEVRKEHVRVSEEHGLAVLHRAARRL